jgi:aldose 1-epimerase
MSLMSTNVLWSRFKWGVLFLLITAAAAAPARCDSIYSKLFGTTTGGEAVTQYTLHNGTGASVVIITYGATVTNLMVPDKNGKLGDVVLGFDTLAGYEWQSPYFGAIIGRVGNRIARGSFTVEGVAYHVPINNGVNSLHGGFRGYDKRVWHAQTAETADGPAVRLTLLDADGDEGFPGNVRVTVIYTLTSKNALRIEYFATADRATPINLTNHCYFNLKDAGATDVLGHEMKVYGQKFLPVDDAQIPTGQLQAVQGTAIDFTQPKPIGKDLAAMPGPAPGGYDHNLCLNNTNGDFADAADVYEPDTGRLMQVWTTEPGLQLYSGNFLDGSITGKGGVVYHQHAALALECQHYPDSINHPAFPPAVLSPGHVYHQLTEYRFSAPAQRPWRL